MEILNNLEEQNKKIISQNDELAKQLKALMLKLAPMVDSRAITENIANQLKESSKNIKSDISVLAMKLGDFERTLQDKQSFFGFTNINMMAIYFIIVLLLCFSNFISCKHIADNELIKNQSDEISNLKNQIETFKTDNPKTAKKYFPDE